MLTATVRVQAISAAAPRNSRVARLGPRRSVSAGAVSVTVDIFADRRIVAAELVLVRLRLVGGRVEEEVQLHGQPARRDRDRLRLLARAFVPGVHLVLPGRNGGQTVAAIRLG